MTDAIVPRRMEYKPPEGMQTDKGYVPVYTTAVIEQPWLDYSADDHATWGTLYTRQRELLVGRACDEFLQAQDAMGMDARAIPRFDQLNEVLPSDSTSPEQIEDVMAMLSEMGINVSENDDEAD